MTEVPASDTASQRVRLPQWHRIVPLGALVIFIGVLAYLIVVPLVRLQILAFEHGARGYREAWAITGVLDSVYRTVGLAFGSLVIALLLGTYLAWAATTISPRLRLLRILPVLPIVVPAVASVVGWTFLLSPHPGYLNTVLRHLPWWSDLYNGPGDIYTLPWIVVITGLQLTAFIYLFVSSGLENLNTELLEAAETSGSSRTGAFFRVTLPLLRPALVYGGGVALLLGLGQFTAPLILGTNNNITVLTTEMYRATQQVPPQYGVAAALGSPLLIFGLLVVLFNRVVVGDIGRFVTHGGRSYRPTTRTSSLSVVSIILYATFSTLLPVVGLVLVAFSTFWSGELSSATLTVENFRAILHDEAIRNAVETSVTTSVIAVLITLPMGYIAAHVLKGQRHRAMRPLLDVVIALPLGVSTVIFGVGFLLTYTSDPFVLYGTKWVLVLVYIALMIPFSTRMQLAGMAAIGDTYVEASRVCGAGLLRTHLSILAPLLRGTFGGAAALMFILLANEFAASLLVRASTVQVMGTVLYDSYGSALYPTVACTALIMIAVTSLGVLAAIGVGGSDFFRNL